MVHLNRVATDVEVDAAKVAAASDFSSISLEDYGADEYTTTVYGSRHAAVDLPRHEMPEKEMPPQV
jgi:glutamate decarboxylase